MESNITNKGIQDVTNPKEALQVDVPIGMKQHSDSDLHLIGETLPEPSRVSDFTSVAAVGQSPNPSREDHAHKLADGTAAAPSLGWGDLGFYKVSAGVVGLAVGGANKFNWDGSRFYAPSSMSIGGWTSDAAYGAVQGLYGYLLLGRASPVDSGVYLRASGNLSLGATGYVDRVTINGTTVTITPTISCNAINSGAISCTTLNTNGNTITAGTINCGGIGASTSTIGGTRVGTWTAHGSYYGIEGNRGYILIGNSAGDSHMYVRSNGTGNLNLGASGQYVTTENWFRPSTPDWAGTGFNVVIDASGHLEANYSKRELKEKIQPLNSQQVSSKIDALNPVSFIFKPKNPDDITPEAEEWRHKDLQYGFIAEEVAEVDPHLAIWQFKKDGDGEFTGEAVPGAWYHEKIIALAIKEIQSLRSRVEKLESMLTAKAGF